MVQLDSTAGYRKMWRNTAGIRLTEKITLIELNVGTIIAEANLKDMVFLDIKPKCKPTIVADAQHLPFKPHAFTDIWFDPPYIESHGKQHNNRYGSFKGKDNWQQFAHHTNLEYHRTLQPQGTLHYRNQYQDKGNILPYYPDFQPTTQSNPTITNLQPRQ